MDKKDIYEHLANIYLDASNKKAKKIKFHPHTFRSMFFVSAVLVIGLSTALYFSFHKGQPFGSEVSLALTNGPLKINFDFVPAKKEIYALDLNRLDISKYKMLGFTLKKADFNDRVSLKVEFTGAFGETSEVYLRDIGHKWKGYRLSFKEFKNITDWSDMSWLKFIVEDWNTKNKKGIIYIDNVRILK